MVFNISRYLSKRSLQTRFQSERLSQQKIELRNKRLYDNIRKGMTRNKGRKSYSIKEVKEDSETDQLETITEPQMPRRMSQCISIRSKLPSYSYSTGSFH